MVTPKEIVQITVLVGAWAMFMTGCGGSVSQTNGRVTEVAAKADEVAELIGGSNGYGGVMMADYIDHLPANVGFVTTEDLAASDAPPMVMQLQNQSGQMCTFHMAYLDSKLGLEEQLQDVEVEAGGTIAVEMPCVEIMGMGSLATVGDSAATLEDGTTVDNQWAVPGFLNTDYVCGMMFSIWLTPDTDDLDQDGDIMEFVVTSDTFLQHVGPIDMGNHMHGAERMMPGMMGDGITSRFTDKSGSFGR